MTPTDIVILVLAILLALVLILYLVLESKKGPCSACRHHGGKRLYKAFRKTHPMDKKGKRGKD